MDKNIIEKELDSKLDLLVLIERRLENLNYNKEGYVEIRKGKYGDKFYHVTKSSDGMFHRKYIKHESLANYLQYFQFTYLKKVQNQTLKNIKALNKFINSYNFNHHDQIYNSINPRKKEYVTPITKTLNQRISEWKKEKYPSRNSFKSSSQHLTENDEFVKSKSELIIADLLFSYKIDYKYEFPLQLATGRIIYPDFTIINPITGEIIYWEHFGLMDDAEYARNFVVKMQEYIFTGIYPGKNLLLTFEDSKTPFSKQVAKILLKEIGLI